MRTCGDWKLWAALALAGKVAHSGGALNYFRFHERSVRKQTEQGGLDTAGKFAGGRWVLALALAGKVAHSGEALNYFRFHERSVRKQTEQVGLDTAENLQVVRWILERVKPTDAVLRRARLQAAQNWIPTVFGMRAPLDRRSEEHTSELQ